MGGGTQGAGSWRAPSLDRLRLHQAGPAFRHGGRQFLRPTSFLAERNLILLYQKLDSTLSAHIMAARSPASRQGSLSTSTNDEVCEDGRCARILGLPVWHCVDCDSQFCEDCWDQQTAHRQGKRGRDGQAHEKTNYHMVKRFERILHPSDDPKEIAEMHFKDSEESTWFRKS